MIVLLRSGSGCCSNAIHPVVITFVLLLSITVIDIEISNNEGRPTVITSAQPTQLALARGENYNLTVRSLIEAKGAATKEVGEIKQVS